MATGLYIGQHCPPNIEAYLDSLSARENETAFDLIVGDDCELPIWIRDSDAFKIRQYEIDDTSGISLILACANVVATYLDENDVAEIRQITQPRWHAPGVLLGARGHDVRTCTRVSQSNFTEYANTDGIAKCRDYVANNVIGRAVFLSDTVYTPAYGGIDLPWWSSAERIEEPRTAAPTHFHPDIDPSPEIFSQAERRILTVGRISQKKGIDLVLDIAAELPAWEFVIVGPERDDELITQAADLPNVRLLGSIDYIEMPAVYAAADVLLSASRVEWGGISRAMLEADAIGLPVVALDRGDAASVATVTVDADPNSIIDGIESVPLLSDIEETKNESEPSKVTEA